MNLAIATSKTIIILAVLLGPSTEIFSYENNCPLLKLASGRVRYRFSMKNVRFNCMRGYQLVGAKYASCMNGKWDAPTPTCVRQGCRVPRKIYINGQFIESYRGAVVKIICNPGYSLMGSPSVYCDGIRWNETFPVCDVLNLNPALACDFESEDLCGWSHDPMQDFNWKKIDLKSPPPGEIGGPGFDHNRQSGVYMFIGSFEPRTKNETTRLFSPVYPPKMSNGSCFKFWYYMSEGNTDVLKIYVKPENTELYDVIPSFWTSGNQGQDWVQGFFPIYPMEDRFQIVIEGTKGAYYTSDTSFDDVKIAFGEECQILESTTTSEYFTTDDGIDYEYFKYSPTSCRFRCNEDFISASSTFTPNQMPKEKSYYNKCDCQEQCIRSKTCCTDFFGFCKFNASTTVGESVTQANLNSSNGVSPEPEIKISNSTSSPLNDFNKQNNEIDPNHPIAATFKIHFPQNSHIQTGVDTINVTESFQTTTKTSSVKLKIQNVTEKTLVTTAPEKNLIGHVEKEQFVGANDSQITFPKVNKIDSEGTKSIGIANNFPQIPLWPKSKANSHRARPIAGPSGPTGPKVEKSFREKNMSSPRTIDGNPKDNSTKSLTNFATIASPTTRTFSKFKKEKFPLNSRLLKKTGLSSNSSKTGDQRTREKGVSGKEPPQAIKIDAEDGGKKENFRKTIEIAGICSALLIVVFVVAIVFYRRSRNQKLERNNLVEDSDVRYLTSDEALDFTLAQPSDDDL